MVRALARRLAWFALLGSILASRSAAANGQSAHLWITEHALTHVPEGPLRELLTRPELRPMLDNGTMFPDGGYPLDDPYAELAHWEPLQGAYLAWIVATHDPPYAGEGAEHLAFLFGMASHGMADQTFDSMYGQRVVAYDGSFGDFDTASDLIMMAEVGGRTAPADWVPYDVLAMLYADAAGYAVDPATMMNGQNLLRLAVNSVDILSRMPDVVDEAAAPFPWGRAHLLDPDVEGSPPCEGELVARYLRVLWALAHEQPLPGPVLGTRPADGGANHPTEAASIESWVTIVMSRGLHSAALTADAFTLQPERGDAVPIAIWHYYGQDSHVVHVQPQADLAADTVYTLSVAPGVQTIHGDALAGYAFRFSTGAQGPEPIVDAWPPDHDPDPGPDDDSGDGGSSGGGSSGEGSGTAPDDTSTGAVDPGPTSGSGDAGGTDGGIAQQGGDDGCACGRRSRGGVGLLALVMASLFRPRRRRQRA